jgi:hypothetical protein
MTWYEEGDPNNSLFCTFVIADLIRNLLKNKEMLKMLTLNPLNLIQGQGIQYQHDVVGY